MSQKPVIIFHHTDITTLQADLCVCTIHSSKNLSRGKLSSLLSRKAGPKVQAEVNSKHPEAVMRCHDIVTKPGNLTNFKKLMFVHLLHWNSDNDQKAKSQEIQQSVLTSLQYAHKRQFASVALPALGMGGLRYPPYEVSMDMLTAIVRFYNTETHTTLKTVHVALLGPDVDSMLMYIQSANKFIEMFKENMLEFGACQQPFNVLPSPTLNALMDRPLAQVKSTWQKFLALFSSIDPVPRGELFRVEVTPLTEMLHNSCKHSFYHAHNSLKVVYLAPSIPHVPPKTSNRVVT